MKKTIIVILLLFALVIPSGASEDELYERQYDALGIDELRDSAPDTGIEFEKHISLNEGLSQIWKRISDSIESIFTSGFRCAITIVAVSFLCSCVGALFSEKGAVVKTSLALVGAIAATAAASGSITSVIGMGRDFIAEMDIFSKALIPTLAAAEASCGSPGAALAKASATLFFSSVLIGTINKVFLPMVYVNIFISTANAATENGILKRMSALVSKAISSSLKIFLGAYISYITVSGVSAGAVDKFGLRAVSLAAGTVPVVGGMMSQVSETVMAGAALLKNSVGVFGVLTIISAFATPFLTMAVNYVLFRSASCLASPVIDGGIAELSDRIAESFGQVLAMCATVALVSFISTIAAMKGTGVL